MENILGDTSALHLPIQPDTTGAVMNMISPIDAIDCCMHLDATDLCSSQILLIINVMDVAVLNDGECSTQMAHDTSLTAVMDMSATDNVRADSFLTPALYLRLADTFTLCLGTILILPLQPLIIIAFLPILT